MLVFGPYNNYFYKNNVIYYYSKIIINFIIYIERSMNVFIIGPQSHFDCIKFKASLVIKIINFNERKNGLSSYACHLLCGCDFLSNF